MIWRGLPPGCNTEEWLGAHWQAKFDWKIWHVVWLDSNGRWFVTSRGGGGTYLAKNLEEGKALAQAMFEEEWNAHRMVEELLQ